MNINTNFRKQLAIEFLLVGIILCGGGVYMGIRLILNNSSMQYWLFLFLMGLGVFCL